MVCLSRAFHNGRMSTSSDSPIGNAIRHFRNLAGLKQEALAERIGVDANTISRFERGHQQPTLERLQALADALERPCSDFFLHIERTGGTRERLSRYTTDHLTQALTRLTPLQREALMVWLDAFATAPGRQD